MAHPCRLCGTESKEEYGPFFHRVWCKNEACPRFTSGMFYVQWQDDNDPVQIVARAHRDFVMRACRIWKPGLNHKQLNDLLFNLSEEAKDLLYPMPKTTPVVEPHAPAS